jgi:peptide/nickel transport system ATP-binding protein
MSLLEVRNLGVEFPGPSGPASVLRDVSFDVEAGRTVALVGESGSGKSVTARAILGLLDPAARVTGGEIIWEGQDLLTLSEKEHRPLRGDAISLILQDAMTSLNPTHTVGAQVAEVLRLHRHMKKKEAWGHAVELLGHVGLRDPAVLARQYPHQLSGGMRQRVVIAEALACRPKLLIADEPTTALDVTMQAQVLDLLETLTREQGTALLLITHDLGVVSDVADEVVVLYAGEILETGPVADVLDRPAHPYTRGLLASLPSRATAGRPRVAITGQIPSLDAVPSGCVFHPRCSYAIPDCTSLHPKLLSVSDQHHVLGENHLAACPVPLPPLDDVAVPAPVRISAQPSFLPERADASDKPLLVVDSLRKVFVTRDIFGGRGRHPVAAVDGVSFSVPAGKTLGIVGESGSGKSTTARLIARLLDPTSGTVTLDGEDLTRLKGEDLRRRRQDLQVVFQDPLGSFDPRRRIRSALREPLTAFGRPAGNERIEELLALVGLPASYANRAPHQLSGGQRQRVSIARALALSPKVLICDEPVASLDVSIQAQVVNLLEELQERLSLTYVFISHDLSLVRHISDEIVVMHNGKVVEHGPAEAVAGDPEHPYTRSLIAAIPGARRHGGLRPAGAGGPLQSIVRTEPEGVML